MKSKLLITCILCTVAFTVNAQTEKGKNFIHGSVGYLSTKNGINSTNNGSLSNYGDTLNTLNIMPRFGHFFSKNLAIGLGIGFANSKSAYGNTIINGSTVIYSLQNSKQHSFNVGPFIRYYIDIADKFKFFGQLNTAIGFGKTDQKNSYSVYNLASSTTSTIITNTNYSYKMTKYSASINPGFVFFPSKRWAAEFSFPLLDYNKIKPKAEDGVLANSAISTSQNFSFFTSFTPNVGFNFHF